MPSSQNYWRLLAYSCGIPVLAYLTFLIVQTDMESERTAAVRGKNPTATNQELSAKSMAVVCSWPLANRHKGWDELCEPYNRVAWLRSFSTETLGATLALLLAVYGAGRLARRNRHLLLNVFRTGAWVMTVATLLIAISHTLLFGTMLYYGPAEFLGVIPEGIIGLAAVGGIAAVCRVVWLLFAFHKEVFTYADGGFLPAEQAPVLWEFVRATAAAIGTEPPRNVIAGTETTFFVTENTIKTAKGNAAGRTLYLSIPLCDILTLPELRAIVGHEMAHFLGQDTEFTRKFYPIFRRGRRALEAVSDSATMAGIGRYPLLPAISLLSFYLESFSEAEAEMSRQRELAADAMGAAITSKRDLAMGLLKVIQHRSAWEQVNATLVEKGAADGAPTPPPRELFRQVAEQRFRAADRAAQIRSLGEQQSPHATDSHPALALRLEALGFTVEELYDAAGDVRPVEPSSTMIPDADEMTQEVLPVLTPASEEIQTVFHCRQAAFAAIEPYGLAVNRSFLVYVSKEGLYGIKARRFLTSGEEYFHTMLLLLNDLSVRPGTPVFSQLVENTSGSFFLPEVEIVDVSFDDSAKWRRGPFRTAGCLKIYLRAGETRQFIPLGGVNAAAARRVILETLGRQSGNQGGT